MQSGTPRIAILRALKLGDLLCAVPALRAFRGLWPRAEITLIGLPSAGEFAERFTHYVDRFVAFPGYPGFPEQPVDDAALRAFQQRIRSERFDLAIQMQGDGTHANRLIASLGARRTAGFYHAAQACPDPATFLLYPDDMPEPVRLAALAQKLGASRVDLQLEFPIAPEDKMRAAELAGGSPYAVIHPGSISMSGPWSAECFGPVGRAINDRGLRVIVTGVAAETRLAAEIAAGASDAVNLAGRTELGTLAAVISGASIVVCNDTGVSHLAAAAGTPSVVIGRRSLEKRWAPLDCLRHVYLCHEPDTARPVTPGQVIRHVQVLLARSRQRVPA
jgi:ADP-heptose:LPS heptosyltransferase